MCVCFKYLITFSVCKGGESENIGRLLIIALENEIQLDRETRGWKKKSDTETERTVCLLNGA